MVASGLFLSAQVALGQPVAEHSQVLLNQDTNEAIALSASGYDSGPGPVTVQITSEPRHGTLVEVGFLAYEYTPDVGYYGGDDFRWGVSDGAQNSNVATCMLYVNRVPLVFGQTVGVNEATSTRIQLAGTDDGRPGPYAVTIAQPPSNGTLDQISLREFDYLPNPGFFGDDSFQFYLSDGLAESNWATVSIRVNQRPVARAQSFVVLPGLSLINWLDFTDDGLLDPVTFEVGVPGHGTVNMIDPAGRFEYLPDPGYSGPDAFAWRAFDGVEYSDVVAVSLQVPPPAPTAIEVGIAFPAAYTDESFDHLAFNGQRFGDLNVDLFRASLGDWSRLEPVDGFYNWDDLDNSLSWALAEGYSVFFTIPAKAPAWDCDPDKLQGNQCVPLDMASFAAFVDALMLHLVDFAALEGGLPIHVIAFGNEWSASETLASYPGTTSDYITQQNIVYDAVELHLPPTFSVALGGLSTGSTRTYAYCKGYLELDGVYSRDSYCPQEYPSGVIKATEFVLENARYDVLDQHLYEFVADWPHMITALVNEALPVEKRSIPIVASEFGGPRGDKEEPGESEQAIKLGDYFEQLTRLPLTEALFYRLIEDGDGSGGTYRYSGLIDRELFDIFLEGGSPDIEKQTYWVFQQHALNINQ